MEVIFYGVIGIITFFAFLHAYAAKSYDVRRFIKINKPKDEVFNFARKLQNEPLWIPWFERDLDATLKYKEEDGKINSIFYWKGNYKVGEGTQKIIKLRQGRIIETKIIFVKPVTFAALTYMGFKEIDENTTKMVWGIRGAKRLPFTILSVFYSPEKLIGKDIEKALFNLKRIIER